MPNESFFDGFPKVSAEEWKQKIIADLKGADYGETLIWHSPEGIAVQPFYHSDTSTSQKIRKKKSGWSVGQLIQVSTPKEANTNALNVIERGVESLWFKISSGKVEFETLLKSIDFEKTSIHLDFQFLSTENAKSIMDPLNLSKEGIHIHYDVIDHLARNGNWFSDQKSDLEILGHLQDSGFKNVFTVDASLYQNSGATIVQQLAFTLAHANEYLNYFDGSNIGIIQFKLAVGSNYFFEIAKLRALRLLWATLAGHYGVDEDCSILAMPTKRNKTLYDYNVNMLRTTTECMSAVLGGADMVCNQPYDVIYHEPNEFGNRIALNQLLLLKNESYFDKIDNAAEGAYYIESLTQDLAERALELFKKIEASGGFLEQLREGSIQEEIIKSASLEQKRFDEGKEVLLGTNKYRNEMDKMKDTIEINPFAISDFGEVAVRPISERRLSEDDEQKRLNDE